MDDLTAPDAGIEVGVGRYGLRTFRPKIVRGMPHLCSVSQDAIPNLDPRFYVALKYRELMVGTHPIAWEDGTCTATCQRTRHEDDIDDIHDPPGRNCGCGIYALDDLKDLHQQYPNDCEQVVTVISASGRTLEHNNGIKTQHARVVAYWVLDHPDDCTAGDGGGPCRVCTKTRRLNSRPKGIAKWSYEPYGAEPAVPGFDRFPYLQCAMTQFQNAQRWFEPDEMAKHYGLKATPLQLPKQFTFPAPGSKVPLQLPMQPGERGHFTTEIPIG